MNIPQVSLKLAIAENSLALILDEKYLTSFCVRPISISASIAKSLVVCGCFLPIRFFLSSDFMVLMQLTVAVLSDLRMMDFPVNSLVHSSTATTMANSSIQRIATPMTHHIHYQSNFHHSLLEFQQLLCNASPENLHSNLSHHCSYVQLLWVTTAFHYVLLEMFHYTLPALQAHHSVWCLCLLLRLLQTA